MAYSIVTYTGNGSTSQFSVPFPYLSAANVSVTVNGAAALFTWLNSGLVQISTAPVNGSSVVIARYSGITSPDVVFSDGSTVQASDINTSETQALYLIQEAADAASATAAGLAAEITRAEAAEASVLSQAETFATALVTAMISLPGGGTLASFFAALPTTLPSTSGILWNNGGSISLS